MIPVVTPTDAEIIQGSPANSKRPEADNVSRIAGASSATTQFAITTEEIHTMPDGTEMPGAKHEGPYEK